MAFAPSLIPVEPAVYSRRARQIRARYARQPGAMHLALRGLADRTDRKPWRDEPRPGSLPASMTSRVSTVAGAIERGFADYLSDRLSSGPFTFSDRMAAIQSAEQIGISRFRANLMLVLAQNPAGGPANMAAPAPVLKPPRAIFWKCLSIAVVTEVMVAGALYFGLR